MAASKWQSIPFFALLILSFATNNCLARHDVVNGDANGKDIHKPIGPNPSLSTTVLESPYGWQYWQWSWGAPNPTWFPWGTSNLYCRPVGNCMGPTCNGFYLEFDYDHIGFSYNNYYNRRNADTVKGSNKISELDHETWKSSEDGRNKVDSDNNEKNKGSDGQVTPRPN